MVLTFKLHNFKKIILFVVFGMSLIVSHYGTSYLVMFMFLFTAIFLKIFKVIKEKIKNKSTNEVIGFTLIYVVFTLGWYIHISNSVSFASLVGIGNTIAHTIFTEFLNPEYSRGAHTLTKKMHLLGQLLKYMYLSISGLIFVGYLKTLFDILKSKSKFSPIYLAFSTYWLGILGAAVAVPFFAVMNPYRLYHLAFFTLAPFSIIGAIFVFNLLKKFRIIVIDCNKAVKFLAVFLMFFMLLNTYFINEMVNQPSYSRYLSENAMLNQKYIDINETGKFYSGIITTYDTVGAKWLSKYDEKNNIIYSGSWAFGNAPLFAYGGIPLHRVKDLTMTPVNGSYIYFMELLVKYKVWYYLDPLAAKCLIYYNATFHYDNLTKKCSKIYDNGGSQILLS
jgi:uncharacterized membrane protein